MNAILILYGGHLSNEAFQPLFNGKNAVNLAIEQAKKFPSVGKTVLLACEHGDFSGFSGIQIEKRASWTKRSLLEKISELQAGFDCVFFAFADCPFLDPALAQAVAGRHLRYTAEYSYADGLPYGLAPEMLSPGTAGILAKILGDDDGAVERDILFSVIQKDINAFDIEAEISAVDLRCHRLNFCADSKRNLLLLKNFIDAADAKIPTAADVERIVEEKPEILRTLPSFYPIQVYGGCPQKCAYCPYPHVTNVIERKDFMESGKFESLLDKIAAFSGDAVIDLSLWGELSLHPEKMKLIEAVVSRSELSLIIETSGLGWKAEELEKCAGLSLNAKKRKNSLAPLSWIVSLDTNSPQRYMEIRGQGFAEANECAKKLFSLFPKDCYVQAVRMKGEEEDTEKFYRTWKEASPSGANIIIQKYDDFCGVLEKKQASDISPLIRRSCWHIMRDMPVLTDGDVPLCRENLAALKKEGNDYILGNVFTDSLENIWQRGERHYKEHCQKNYTGLCVNCDEYYTYNF
ncbi:MAG: spiro-SPASM protein [Treponema sp.]|jgi:spiro-SPASM protein|nr:spiro-SPASM protein [Treponema sp.]